MVSHGASKSECFATAFACSLPRPGIVSLMSSNSNDLEKPVATPVLCFVVSTCSGRYVISHVVNHLSTLMKQSFFEVTNY